MKLMTYLGLTLVLSLPAKAIYVDGGIACYSNVVEADTVTMLEFDDVYWYDLSASHADVTINGPSGSAYNAGYGWGLAPAVAYTYIAPPTPGTYNFFGNHWVYGSSWGWVYVWSASASCSVQGAGGGNDPTPAISSFNPSTWNAGQGYSVSIYGTGFGTNPELVINGAGVSSYITYGSNTYISAQVSVSPNAPNGTATIQVISHGYNGMGFQGPPGGGGPASPFTTAQVLALLAPSFSVQYHAYIPVNYVSGPTPCLFYYPGFGPILWPSIYKGDGGSSTYRQMESVQITPAWQNYTNLIRATGETRNYGFGSPANGSTLSSLDEDGPGDCYLFHASAHAGTGGLFFGASYSGSQATIHFYGGTANPLETGSPEISMDVHTVVNGSNPQAPTAQVYFSHDCYPAHRVTVNGQIVYSYVPPDNSLYFIAQCLYGLGQVSGQTSIQSVPPQ